MSWYARPSLRLIRQLIADGFVVAWSGAWWFVAAGVQAAINALAVPARSSAAAARRLAEELRRGAESAGSIPAVGDRVRQPFDSGAHGVDGLVVTLTDQAAGVERLATTMGWVVFAIPVIIVVTLWLPPRVRFARRSSAAHRYIDSGADLDLFALRAMANQPMHLLARISDDPVHDWRTNNRAVITSLADLELRSAGLRLPRAHRQSYLPQ